jgi:ATP-binding cassette subfamily C protein CydCD
VEENVRLARPVASAGELRGALAKARLLDWVENLPDGIRTRVCEHGDRVSTADALTAELIAVTRCRAVLLVTHRLAGLTAVDDIVVLDAGRVVHRGDHADLVSVDGLPVRRMWSHT